MECNYCVSQYQNAIKTWYEYLASYGSYFFVKPNYVCTLVLALNLKLNAPEYWVTVGACSSANQATKTTLEGGDDKE